MGLLGKIKNWFGVQVDKFKVVVKKLFNLAKPFLQEVLSDAAQQVWKTSSGLMLEAIQYIATQGLPTEDAKKAAFYEYMRQKGNAAIKDLRTRELNFLRELALSIYDKASKS